MTPKETLTTKADPLSQCGFCKFRPLCYPHSTTPALFKQMESALAERKRFTRGQTVFRAGEPFTAFYTVRTGVLKSVITSDDGFEQITRFHMSGDILGLDGLYKDEYTLTAIALEDCELCIMPYEKLLEIAAQNPTILTGLNKTLSKEIIRGHEIILLLGSMHANERLAAFLLALSKRLEERGFSRTEFILRMTRAEIGSMLGLKLETVSRVLSKFAEMKLIEIHQKHVRILDPEGLHIIIKEHHNTKQS